MTFHATSVVFWCNFSQMFVVPVLSHLYALGSNVCKNTAGSVAYVTCWLHQCIWKCHNEPPFCSLCDHYLLIYVDLRYSTDLIFNLKHKKTVILIKYLLNHVKMSEQIQFALLNIILQIRLPNLVCLKKGIYSILDHWYRVYSIIIYKQYPWYTIY